MESKGSPNTFCYFCFGSFSLFFCIEVKVPNTNNRTYNEIDKAHYKGNNPDKSKSYVDVLYYLCII